MNEQTGALSGESFRVTALYNYLCNEQGLSVPIALAITGALVLMVAILLRTLIYLAFRATGKVRYTQVMQGIENICVWSMAGAGAILGYVVFGNILSALLCGGCFCFVTIGVVLQAMTANEKNRKW